MEGMKLLKDLSCHALISRQEALVIYFQYAERDPPFPEAFQLIDSRVRTPSKGAPDSLLNLDHGALCLYT